jgi:hypothetical protein
MSFYLVNPFVMDNMAMGRLGTKGPGIIGKKSSKFSTHDSFPPRISSGLAIASGLNVREDIVETEERIFGMKKLETKKLFRFK